MALEAIIKDRLQPNATRMAQWMFDHGHGHVDEPRFMLNGMSFYVSDFLPERRAVLNEKIDALKGGEPDTEITDFIVYRTSKFPKWRTDLDDKKTDKDLERIGGLLNLMEQGYMPFFKEDGPDREKLMLESERRYFVNTMEQVPVDILEFLIRSRAYIHLNSGFADELGVTYLDKRVVATDNPFITREGDYSYTAGSNINVQNAKGIISSPLFSNITVAGISECTSQFLKFLMCHESAHNIAYNNPEYNLKSNEYHQWSKALNNLYKAIGHEKVPLTKDMDFFPDEHYINTSLRGMIFPDKTLYTNDSVRNAEVFCNMVALSFGELSGEEGAQKIRQQFQEYPSFVDAIIGLRDTARNIFNQRLQQLRIETSLPKTLTLMTGQSTSLER